MEVSTRYVHVLLAASHSLNPVPQSHCLSLQGHRFPAGGNRRQIDRPVHIWNICHVVQKEGLKKPNEHLAIQLMMT